MRYVRRAAAAEDVEEPLERMPTCSPVASSPFEVIAAALLLWGFGGQAPGSVYRTALFVLCRKMGLSRFGGQVGKSIRSRVGV